MKPHYADDDTLKYIAKLEADNKAMADSVSAILEIHADWRSAKFRGETAMQFISGFIPAIQKARM